jgi:hypothetical protein
MRHHAHVWNYYALIGLLEMALAILAEPASTAPIEVPLSVATIRIEEVGVR